MDVIRFNKLPMEENVSQVMYLDILKQNNLSLQYKQL